MWEMGETVWEMGETRWEMGKTVWVMSIWCVGWRDGVRVGDRMCGMRYRLIDNYVQIDDRQASRQRNTHTHTHTHTHTRLSRLITLNHKSRSTLYHIPAIFAASFTF